MSYLGIDGKAFLVMGVANDKSVAWHIAKGLEANGAKVIFSVRSEARKTALEKKLLQGRPVLVCDVEKEYDIADLAQVIGKEWGPIDGFVHSMAFANYSKGFFPFHETNRQDFVQAMTISCFSLVETAKHLKPFLKPDASVVALSISSQVTAESYGYMSPIKAALESCVRFLAKSFSQDTQIRFNAIKAGPLKTSASAGIPNYIDNFLFAEKMTLRKKALQTHEVADLALFLLSQRSSGINGQGIVINAGMDLNYFDREIVNGALKK
jgi:enoyl-[acyl-carrier protein] reductase I